MLLNNLCWACSPGKALLLLILVLPSAKAHEVEFSTGTVIEKVTSKADTTQSYALYLPSNYTPAKQWPVIYAFDPSAMGILPVRLYRDAAEKFGYIIVGSNNAQNGMQSAPLQAAISSMIGDTRKRLSIDETRVYTSGFSGGARIATRVASSCNGCIAGVIACGAGFPSDIKINSAIGFVFYGTVGVEDFNYPEMIRLEEKLNSLKIKNHVTRFEGGHRWASSQLLIDAIEWMELEAMRVGRRVRDEALIEEAVKKRIVEARAVSESKDAFAIYKSQASLASDFRDLRDMRDVDKRASVLGESKEVKQAIRREREQLREQQEIADRLIELGSRLLAEPSIRAVALKELKTSVGELRKKAQSTTDPAEKLVVKRSLSQVLAQTYEAAVYNYLPNRQYNVAIVNLLVAEEVKPGLARVPFELARAYAMTGEKKKAIEALRRAVNKGLIDASIIEVQPDFEAIRSEIEFKAIVEGLKKERK